MMMMMMMMMILMMMMMMMMTSIIKLWVVSQLVIIQAEGCRILVEGVFLEDQAFCNLNRAYLELVWASNTRDMTLP